MSIPKENYFVRNSKFFTLIFCFFFFRTVSDHHQFCRDFLLNFIKNINHVRNSLDRTEVADVGYNSFVVLSDNMTFARSEEHTSELQSRPHLVCRLLLEKKKKKYT